MSPTQVVPAATSRSCAGVGRRRPEVRWRLLTAPNEGRHPLPEGLPFQERAEVRVFQVRMEVDEAGQHGRAVVVPMHRVGGRLDGPPRSYRPDPLADNQDSAISDRWRRDGQHPIGRQQERRLATAMTPLPFREGAGG